MRLPDSILIEDMTSTLPGAAIDILIAHDILTVADLRATTRAELRALDGMDDDLLAQVMDAIEDV